ncbi:hypothetical protein D9613_009831 [Agrocybe pediades]|uniref:ATP-dependent DNA helicase n=1 Tax=Agrocybe pediades TaxID=84607 RepID=A0A8H4VQS3_9AGAR|nr:hypothetical protein D9613_009831 [Agrocybe pediades]
MFANPTQKIYDKLPPPVNELDDVLAYIFTGPTKPTPEEMKRTPLLVRRNAVAEALKWLILNHADYADLQIDYTALDQYPEDDVPVTIFYQNKDNNKQVESRGLDDMEIEDGTESGDCLFTVHGLTGTQLENIACTKILRAEALKHLDAEGKVLAIGHSSTPESIYNNPRLYPQMFPHLFPYGLGGVGSIPGVGDVMHKRNLLMYHDKRFQVDPHFPLIAFNQEQVKKSTRSGLILAESKRFDEIADRVLNIDTNALNNLIKRMEEEGSNISPTTEEEMLCYKLLQDIDCLAGKVEGTSTSKKIQRNEIWSLISYIGAPSWFITYSPADVRNPICIYWAAQEINVDFSRLTNEESMRMVVRNPVASARFFHFMVEMFLKHILGVDSKQEGIYGKTAAYYGTVEQQGRLALHLHLLLWIDGALTPQEVRDRIIDKDSDFIKSILDYLSSAAQGEFNTGSKEQVSDTVHLSEQSNNYHDPTRTLPTKPPPLCTGCKTSSCDKCLAVNEWWSTTYLKEIDDILLKSNVHVCNTGLKKNGDIKKNKDYIGCLNNKWKKCKGRFPREIIEESHVDTSTGRILLKKLEAYLNNFTNVLTYLLRCNTDVTSLHSGTAVKAVVAYVSDYITKCGLKTHTIFETIRSVYARNSDVLQSNGQRTERARKLLTKIVNSLTVKMEIGAPMASMYLLGNPDHYTSHTFVPFYWKSYVNYIIRDASRGISEDEAMESDDSEEKVILMKIENKIYPSRIIDDYIYRPDEYECMSLYDWVRLSRRHTIKGKKANKTDTEDESTRADNEFDLNETESSHVEDQDEERTASDASSSDGEPELSKNINAEYINSRSGKNRNEHANANEKSRKRNGFKYKEGHPLRDTHVVTCVKDNKKLVPNFIGGSIPRETEHNADYYYLTMLTLFKPWRTAKDIKGPTDTWKEAFSNYTFSERQNDVMKFFRVRYECLDARDDYRAQLIKATAENTDPDPHSALPGSIADLNKEENFYGVSDETTDILHDNDSRISGTGKTGNKRDLDRKAIRLALEDIGWFNTDKNLLCGEEEMAEPICITPSIKKTGKQWRADVALKRQYAIQARIAAKQQNATQNSTYRYKELQPDDHEGSVKIVDKAELNALYECKAEKDMVDSIASEFKLNAEQFRAYKIAADYVIGKGSGNLRMYIGGMGGTGKTQVIKAITTLFNRRGESKRFLIMAPTGTAAALLGGSTYHYILGMREGNRDDLTLKMLAQVKERLEGVDFIFFDEISMLSCADMYKICERLALALGREDVPFGGLHIIFAGDFAQLPPVIGKESAALYSGEASKTSKSATTLSGQKAAIGKAMWHQVVKVVILRQNMRQKQQTAADKKLRIALENMRYKSCTAADISFLRTRIAGKLPGMPNINDKKYRHQSIITAWNDQKDEINALGSRKFAKETKQQLHRFYSIDETVNPDGGTKKKDEDNKSKRTASRKFHLSNITPMIREKLWNMPPSTNDQHIPGVVDICHGMPIMIRYNEATELCMTRGQEGIIVGWQSATGPHEKPILDVLFVKLTNPPQIVQFDGLPENVVPLTMSPCTITVQFDSGWSTTINRTQIQFLPNFSMTDYASQGKTRPINIVDLTHCPNHQSYYTCLSRSASAHDTIIIKDINIDKITGGTSGWLRQEFRELELLDYITRLDFENKLPHGILQETRKSTIRAFREWKGKDFMPENLHPAIRWEASEEFITDDTEEKTMEWRIVKPEKHSAKDQPKNSSKKRKLAEHTDEDIEPPRKRVQHVKTTADVQADATNHIISSVAYEPIGLPWDATNWSCAYDTLFTLLRHTWIQDKSIWTETTLLQGNPFLTAFMTGLIHNANSTHSFAQLRDAIRSLLHRQDPILFQYGRTPISIYDLISTMTRSTNELAISMKRKVCLNCGWTNLTHTTNRHNSIIDFGNNAVPDINAWFATPCDLTAYRCQNCAQRKIAYKLEFMSPPPVLYISINTLACKPKISRIIEVPDQAPFETKSSYALCGIIYYGSNHFTCRLTMNEHSWYYDGMIQGGNPVYEGVMSFDDTTLLEAKEKIAIGVLYRKIT